MEEKERKLPYRILGVYKPTILDADQIVRDLSTLLHNAGFPPNYITMRSPSWHEDKYNVNELRDVAWHRDINSNNAVGLVMWSNKNPTQIRIADEVEIWKVFQPEPYEVILADNRVVQHRGPTEDLQGRWFFRTAVNLKPGDLDNAK